ncbi:MAG TPA: APC family permease [Actinomycetota bacterium]|jgi:APA family basic amino acid/polyamine antiporter|nr:APC family permease [Actinomycetota bacterium]
MPDRLDRRLGVGDAVVVGLGAMLGAGVFAAVGPAAGAAGSWLLAGLVVAGAVAYANASSSAALAAVYPESGGAYVYGRRRLGPFWGFLAGWAFLAGKLASCAAMALTLGSYVAPPMARPVALAGLAAVTVANYLGVARTVAATRVVVAVVLAALAAAVAGMLLGGQADPANLAGPGPGPHGVLQAAGLLFFAFAGYARIATLGEEVTDPARTIPRAVPLALGIVLAVYAVVAVAALLAVGPAVLARSAAPLAEAVGAGRLAALEPLVRVGAAVASLGVLLSLQAGLSRTGFAMAANGDLPRALAAVHPRYRVPHRAELAVAVLVAVALLAFDLRGAIGFSSTLVLVYYAVANAAAWTLGPGERRWPRWVAGAGLAGCLLLAASLPAASVLAGAAVLAAGAAAWVVLAGARHGSGGSDALPPG